MPETLDAQTIIQTGKTEDVVLNSIYEIENLLLYLEEIQKDMDYFADLKKHRAKTIDEKIDGLKSKTDDVRKIIQRTMVAFAPERKTLQFPGIAKVTRRKNKDGYAIEDEDALLGFLDQEEVDYKSEVVDKKKVTAAIEILSAKGKDIPGVVDKPGVESISVTFEDKKSAAVATGKRSQANEVPIDKLDALEV